MKLLLQAALICRRHYTLLIISLVAMFSLTIASQLEMCSLGVLTSTGADFFALFGREKEDGKVQAVESVSKQDVEERWSRIDKEGKGTITKSDAAASMAKRDRNPLNNFIYYLNHRFNFSRNYTAVAVILVAIAFYKALGLFASRYFTQVVAILVSKQLRQRYFDHIQSLPLSFYQQHQIGGLSSRVVSDASQVASAINAALLNYVQTPFTFLTNLILCFYLSVKLTLFIFIGLPCIIIPIIFLARRIKRIAKQMQKNQESFATILIEFLSGIQTVKIYAMEEFSRVKYEEQNERMAFLEKKSARYTLIGRPILHMITGMFLAAVILYGSIIAGMSLSDVLVFCGLLYLLYEPVKKFGDENSNIQKGVAAAERMFEVLNLKPHIEDKDGAVEFVDFHDRIVFDHVWFRYEDDWVLKDLSFSIEKGKMVALVGPTGAGKSTIAQLLPRLYEAQKGTITMDGRSLQSYTQKSLREGMAFVPQKPFLFLDTVRENIVFGRNFSDEEVKSAACRAHAAEFIEELPQNYQTPIAETGKNLSGGQQQRLAIARALIKKAPILILDEATSALDANSENRIKMAMEELRGSVTQIVIAHRLTTIEGADKIIFLDKGKMVAEGTKEELLRICPDFRRMWEMMHMPSEEVFL